jgi:two-component system, NarL family, sensor kinase
MATTQPEIAQIYLIISVAVVAMLLMAGSIILFVLYYQKRMVQEQFKRQQMELEYQKKMMEAALESQENERRRVAGDLHDSIGAMLSTIRVSLTTYAKRNSADGESINESKKMLDDTIESVRRISRDLMPSTLEKFGLSQAVKEMCERFQSTAALPIIFEEPQDTPVFTKSRELMIFRIVQELLNNALKHAEASVIKVSFHNGEGLEVIVEDNGKGFNAEDHKNDKSSGKGLGLFNIENRARLVGASVNFNASTVQGSKIIINIPYEKV